MELQDVIGIVVVAALVLLLVYVGIKAFRYARQTRGALRQWAERNGWTFTPKEPHLADRWTQSPIRGAGSADNVMRGTVPEGTVTAFTHRVTAAGSSMSTTRAIALLDVGTALPIAIVTTPGVTLAKPLPPETVSLGPPLEDWRALAVDSAAAAGATRLFTAPACQRLEAEAQSLPRLELTLEGQEIIVSTLGYLEVDSLERSIALLRDLARLMELR